MHHNGLDTVRLQKEERQPMVIKINEENSYTSNHDLRQNDRCYSMNPVRRQLGVFFLMSKINGKVHSIRVQGTPNLASSSELNFSPYLLIKLKYVLILKMK